MARLAVDLDRLYFFDPESGAAIPLTVDDPVGPGPVRGLAGPVVHLTSTLTISCGR